MKRFTSLRRHYSDKIKNIKHKYKATSNFACLYQVTNDTYNT